MIAVGPKQSEHEERLEAPSFRVAAVPARIAREVRATLKSPQYGHPAYVELAGGTGPCRSCLHMFDVGAENRILFTYNPFEGIDSYPSPCPIFVHEKTCTPHSGPGFPEDLRSLPLVFEAYGRGRWLVMQERLRDGKVEPVIEKMFAHPVVEYIHVRHQEAGCFIAQIDRNPAGNTSEDNQRDSPGLSRGGGPGV